MRGVVPVKLCIKLCKVTDHDQVDVCALPVPARPLLALPAGVPARHVMNPGALAQRPGRVYPAECQAEWLWTPGRPSAAGVAVLVDPRSLRI